MPDHVPISVLGATRATGFPFHSSSLLFVQRLKVSGTATVEQSPKRYQTVSNIFLRITLHETVEMSSTSD